jgi:hypothetical protein
MVEYMLLTPARRFDFAGQPVGHFQLVELSIQQTRRPQRPLIRSRPRDRGGDIGEGHHLLAPDELIQSPLSYEQSLADLYRSKFRTSAAALNPSPDCRGAHVNAQFLPQCLPDWEERLSRTRHFLLRGVNEHNGGDIRKHELI